MRFLFLLFTGALFASCPFEGLKEDIDAIISHMEANVQIGIKVVSLKHAQTLYEKNPEKLFIPASNLKLFTGAAALAILGVDYRFDTHLLLDDLGNLYLKGSGDPTLKRCNLEDLAGQLKMRQVKEVKNIIIDHSAFDEISQGPGWMEFWSPPMGAITVDHNKEAASSPPRFAGELLLYFLQKAGILVQGEISIGITPVTADVLATHVSEPLSQVVLEMMKESDNLYADCLFKKVGEAYLGAPGTWQKGALAVRQFLKRDVGMDISQMVLLDGSGLSRYNLVAPYQFIKFLSWMKEQFPFAPEFMSSLSIAGVDGSLRRRMVQAKNRLRAEPGGAMTGVTGISGYVKTRDDELLAFSILMNGPMDPTQKTQIEDEICVRLAQFMRN